MNTIELSDIDNMINGTTWSGDTQMFEALVETYFDMAGDNLEVYISESAKRYKSADLFEMTDIFRKTSFKNHKYAAAKHIVDILIFEYCANPFNHVDHDAANKLIENPFELFDKIYDKLDVREDRVVFMYENYNFFKVSKSIDSASYSLAHFEYDYTESGVIIANDATFVVDLDSNTISISSAINNSNADSVFDGIGKIIEGLSKVF